MDTVERGDAELLQAWRDGDAHAGEVLFDRHINTVVRFFRNKVREGADDLAQHTFLRMIEGKQRIREDQAFRAFMLGIARNVMYEHLRELGRGRGVDPEVDAVAGLDPGPTTLAGRREEHRLLLEALRRLPLEHQVALELFYWEGMRGAEIAEVMGVSHSAMRSRLAKARALLSESMESLAASPQLLASTMHGLETWAAQLRGQLGES
ncbi:MAG: sigma-70 family RNA polymerase sigma factor [Myxococcales bacterium]|uniref:Sigma-24 FecI-like protein n=1 Tax=Pseudenhygromyxa salsuginis TaxID=442868 RepID=A0A3S7UWM2_9BACT|nr:sigma-24 FecI-like protein [Pseudenhygromyxa salsuginis]MCA9684797.1 sigma-70 family RNA polymerase sigma factor [Myxococcales bacterium]MCA9699667.1 sigma-70 family RNA polymerase sigma factor [Myxococcales bacterium]